MGLSHKLKLVANLQNPKNDKLDRYHETNPKPKMAKDIETYLKHHKLIQFYLILYSIVEILAKSIQLNFVVYLHNLNSLLLSHTADQSTPSPPSLTPAISPGNHRDK